MAELTQIIRIVLQGIDDTKAAFKSGVNNAKGYQQAVITAQKSASAAHLSHTRSIGQLVGRQRQLTDSTKGFGSVMRMSMPDYKEWVAQGSKGVTAGGRLASKIRFLTHGMRGFRMEMLGVMFFGMAMQRMFMGLVQPAMEAAGIFEIISMTLMVLFLPIVLEILPRLLELSAWFMNLPEGVKLAIGAFVLVGVAVGTLLMVFGTLGLGIGSIIQAFALLFPITAGTTSAITSVGAAFLAFKVLILAPLISFIVGTLLPILALVGAAALILYIAWQQNGAAIQAALDNLLAVFNKIFGGILKVVEGVMDIIFGILELDADKAFGGFEKIAEGAIDFVTGLFIDLVPAIMRVLAEITRGILMWGAKLPGIFMELGGKLLEALADGIRGAYDAVKEAIRNIPYVGPYIVGGMDIAEGVAATVTQGIGSALAGATEGIGTAVSGISDFFGGLAGAVGFQHGGIVTRPTLGLIGEKGPEAVIPLNEGGFPMNISPTYNINATISSDIDIRALVEKINSLMVSDYRRLTYR